MMKTRKIFGREPAVIASLIEGMVLLLTAFGLGLPADTVVAINVTVSGALTVYVAWGTIDKATAALTQLAKALITLFVGLGIDVTPEQTAAVVFVISTTAAAWQRTQVSAVVPPPLVPVAPGSVAVTEVR